MTTSEMAYLVFATLVTCMACIVAFRRRASLSLLSPGYRAQLLSRPRLGVFAVALAAFVFVAPLTGDPTWDAVDAIFMSVGCYVFAPWTCAVIYRAKQTPWLELALALLFSLVVVSFSHDLYTALRDGVFPPTSRENLVASSILYILGGLFFSLGHHRERGLLFVFMDARWPAWSGDAWSLRGASKALLLASLLAAPVVIFMMWTVMSELGLWSL